MHSTYKQQRFQLDSCRVTLLKHGDRKYRKMSYPVHTGIFSEIETREFCYHFNLNNEIIRIIGKGKRWPHPHEWLKRTNGNKWVYYSTGGYTGVFETTGEYYLPNLPYSTNNALGGSPFKNGDIKRAISNWHHNLHRLSNQLTTAPETVMGFMRSVLSISPDHLASRAEIFTHRTTGPVSVLPPDTRHVDYNVIPILLSEGCLYKCRFCKVKNSKQFAIKSDAEIKQQIAEVKNFLGADLLNYNSIFIGEHDGLNGGTEKVLFTIHEALEALELNNSWCTGANVFLFGSAFSLLHCPDLLFEELARLPVATYINIGLESADQKTLDFLGKPLKAEQVVAAFDKIQDVNDRYQNIEITTNFVTDDSLGKRHYQTLIALIRDRIPKPKSKGCVYLSSLKFDSPSRDRLFKFYRLKTQSRIPLFLYTIQQL